MHELGNSFNYFEMCLVDSYIFQKDIWSKISELTGHIENASDEITGIKLRIDRARQYIKYLSYIDERWVVECKRRGLGDSWSHPRIETEVQKRLEDDMKKVLNSAENMARRNIKDMTQH